MSVADGRPGMDAVFRALADPSRRILLDRLNSRNGQTLTELCDGLGMTRQSVSKHLAVLEQAAVVVTERRGREKLHFLNAAPISAVADRWLRPFDRRRAEALADLTTALESTTMTAGASPEATRDQDREQATEPMAETTAEPTTETSEFVYSTYIKTTPETLWNALIDPAFTERYWGATLESDWRPGSPIAYTDCGVRIEDPAQVVRAADRPRLLSYTWHTMTREFGEAMGASPDHLAAMAAEPRSHVTFTIEPLGDLVRLTVVHAGLGVGGAILEGVSSGWPMILASLKSLLETGEPLQFEDWK